MEAMGEPIRTTVRVISLKADDERRRMFAERAAHAGVKWTFFDARTELAPSLIYDEDLVIVRRGRPLSRAELGCYSSHFCLWEEFLESDSDQLIVLEDDTAIDWNFLRKVCDYNFTASGIEFLRLASLAIPPSINMGEFLGRYLVHFLGYALGGQGYLFTRRGADHMRRLCKVVRGPVDDAMDQSWWGGLPNLAIYHHPVLEISGPSRIGAERNADFKMPQRLKRRRLWFRVQEKVRSRAYRLFVRIGFGPRVRGVDNRWL